MRCKPGIMAKVIGGAFETKGPNIGKIVEVVSFYGVHPEFGPTWLCMSSGDLVTEYGGVTPDAHFADDWLEPIEPPSPVKVVDKELETV